jgi:hypothetical protein
VAFRDLTDVLGVTPPKTLPIHGEQVSFPARVSARTGMLLLTLQHRASAGEGVKDVVDSLALDDDAAAELERDLLGEAGARRLDELGVIGDARAHVMGTLIAWHLGGEEAASATWEAGPVTTQGKAAAASNRATRRRTAGQSSKAAGTAAARSKGTSTSAPTSGGASSDRRTTKATASRRGSSSTGKR